MTFEYNTKNISFMRRSHAPSVCNEPIILDIETANNHADDPRELRTWIVSVQLIFNGEYYLVRKPEDVVDFFNGLYDAFGFNDDKRAKNHFVCYIHNSSYDLSYLIPYFERGIRQYGKRRSKGLIIKENKFITYTVGSFEFRCSYQLSGMSLEKWSNEMNTEHKKRVGLYDYDKVLYQDSELDDEEQDYDKYDVLTMRECLDKQLEYHRDDMTSVPFTKTGYIRRTLRASCNSDKTYRKKYFENTKLDSRLYQNMRDAYSGGYTHNNRYHIDEVIEATIGHRDFKSHYPTQMAVNDFPLGTPQMVYDVDMTDDYIDIPDILDMSPEFSTLTEIVVYEARLRTPEITMPFLAEAKGFGKVQHDLVDNGRYIMFKSEDGVKFTFTNYDLEIITEQYEMDYAIGTVWRMKNEPLPECILSVVNKYFKGKSDKKNVVKDLTEKYGKLDPRTIDAQFELQMDKEGLNSIYGCCATNPLRDSWTFNDNVEFKRTMMTDDAVIADALNKYYARRNSFLPYQVGVWITAMARHELYEYVKAVGYENVLYCDTDSIFYIKNDDTETAIEALNAEKHAKASYVVLDNGKREYYDVFDSEPDCKAFKGLHSKCYGVVTDKGLELTIAGVPARTLIGVKDGKPVYKTREEELAGEETDPLKALDKLTFGVEFTVNTGTTAIYIGALGNDTWREPTIIEIDGHEISTAGGCVIRKTDKKVIRDFTYSVEYEMDMFAMSNGMIAT